MRQTKIRGGYVLRRGFKCRGEDLDKLFFDNILWFVHKEKPYELSDSDVDRLISFLKRWKTRKTSLHESRVRIRANAHSIIRETDNLI